MPQPVLKLYLHPLASYCWKALIAFYENGTPFEPHIVDLGNEQQRADFFALWPIGKFPLLRDTARGCSVPESSIIIEYLDHHYPGPTRLIPADPELARQTRLVDRLFDLHVHTHMQKIVTDRIRPEGSNDPYGVEHARSSLRTAYQVLERDLAGKTWATGDMFTMADCAAGPALYYGNRVLSLEGYPVTMAYLQRLIARPSFARVLREAQPYFAMFPE